MQFQPALDYRSCVQQLLKALPERCELALGFGDEFVQRLQVDLDGLPGPGDFFLFPGEVGDGWQEVCEQGGRLRGLRLHRNVELSGLLLAVAGVLVLGIRSAKDAGSDPEVAEDAASLVDHDQALQIGAVLVLQQAKPSK